MTGMGCYCPFILKRLSEQHYNNNSINWGNTFCSYFHWNPSKSIINTSLNKHTKFLGNAWLGCFGRGLKEGIGTTYYPNSYNLVQFLFISFVSWSNHKECQKRGKKEGGIGQASGLVCFFLSAKKIEAFQQLNASPKWSLSTRTFFLRHSPLQMQMVLPSMSTTTPFAYLEWGPPPSSPFFGPPNNGCAQPSLWTPLSVMHGFTWGIRGTPINP